MNLITLTIGALEGNKAIINSRHIHGDIQAAEAPVCGTTNQDPINYWSSAKVCHYGHGYVGIRSDNLDFVVMTRPEYDDIAPPNHTVLIKR
jgi:hypothetical protein